MTLKKIGLTLWTLPQYVLAKSIIFYLTISGKIDFSVPYFNVEVVSFIGKSISSFSLGETIFLNSNQVNRLTLAHEYGHTLQSRYTGIFYLIIVGLPSVVLNILARKIPKYRTNYYKYYPESWADSLGRVNRY